MSKTITIEIAIPEETTVGVATAKRALEMSYKLYFSKLFMKTNKTAEDRAQLEFMELLDTGRISKIHLTKQRQINSELVVRYLEDKNMVHISFRHLLLDLCSFIVMHGGPSDENLASFAELRHIKNNQITFQVIHKFKEFYREEVQPCHQK